MKGIPLILVIILALVIGAVVGYLISESMDDDKEETEIKEPEEVSPEKSIIKWIPESERGWSVEGRDAVRKIIKKVEALVEEINDISPMDGEQIELIQKLFEGNGRLTAHDGTTLHGKDEIGAHFSSMTANTSITNFKVMIQNILSKELTHMLNKAEAKDEDILHSVYFLFTTAFEMDGKVIDPPGSTNWWHRRVCDDGNDDN